MLIVQGAKDAFGTPAELRLFFDVLPSHSDLYIVEQGNHSLDVPKRSGVQASAILGTTSDAIVAWTRLQAAR